MNTQCGCTGCTNPATHTWSGHPTCDDCATPSSGRIPRLRLYDVDPAVVSYIQTTMTKLTQVSGTLVDPATQKLLDSKLEDILSLAWDLTALLNEHEKK